jgi:hypothetical protein
VPQRFIASGDTRLYGSQMPYPPSAYDLHQRERWTRHDAHLWIRQDAARFYKPGTDLAEVFPTLKRQREAAEDAAFAAKIAGSRRFLAAIRAEVDELKAALARRRLEEAKYSPSQPRVPAGNPRGGQWADRGGGQGTVASPSQDTSQSQDADFTQPVGNVDRGDVSGSSELGDLFRIKPDDTRLEGVEVGGDVIRVCIATGISPWNDDFGIKKYSVTYDCAGGYSFTRPSIGGYRGIVRDPR